MKSPIRELGRRQLFSPFVTAALVLSLITISNRATNNMIVTTVPLLGKYVFLFPNFYAGMIVSVYYVANIAGNTLLNPRIGPRLRRPAFMASYCTVAIALYLFSESTATTAWILVALVGFAFGMISPNIATAASVTTKAGSPERLVALYALALSVSLVLGPSLESYLLTTFGYHTIFLAFIAIWLVGLALSPKLSFPDEKNVTTDGAKQNDTSGLKCAITVGALYFIPFSAMTSFLAIFAVQSFGIPSSLGYASFVPFFAASFATRAYMVIRPLRSLRGPILLSILATTIGIIGMNLSPDVSVFYAVMTILGIPHGLVYTTCLTIIARSSSVGRRNSMNSYFFGFMNSISVVTPIFIGYLSDLVGIHMTFALLLLPVAIASAVFFPGFWKSALLR